MYIQGEQAKFDSRVRELRNQQEELLKKAFNDAKVREIYKRKYTASPRSHSQKLVPHMPRSLQSSVLNRRQLSKSYRPRTRTLWRSLMHPTSRNWISKRMGLRNMSRSFPLTSPPPLMISRRTKPYLLLRRR